MDNLLKKIKYVLSGEQAQAEPMGIWVAIVLCLFILRFFFYEETNYYMNKIYSYLCRLN